MSVSVSLYEEHPISHSQTFFQNVREVGEKQRRILFHSTFLSLVCLFSGNGDRNAEINTVIFALYFSTEIKRQCSDNTILQHHISSAPDDIINDRKCSTPPHKDSFRLHGFMKGHRMRAQGPFPSLMTEHLRMLPSNEVLPNYSRPTLLLFQFLELRHAGGNLQD